MEAVLHAISTLPARTPAWAPRVAPAAEALPRDVFVPVKDGSIDVACVSSWERPQDVAEQLRRHLKAWPLLQATVAMAPTDRGTTRLMVASRDDALVGSAPRGVYGIIADLCSAPSIRDAGTVPAAASVWKARALDGGAVHELEVPGLQTPRTLDAALREGRSPNDLDTLRRFLDDLPKGRVAILLGGPSAAGKTTLTGAIRGLAGDREVTVLSGDMYFRDKDDPDYPMTPQGTHDWDSPQALHLDELGDDINRLLDEGAADVPIYDFNAVRPGGWRRPVNGLTGCRLEQKEHLELKDDGILVIDSLHATNPAVVAALQETPHAILYLDTRCAEDRLVRRIIRDYAHRDTSAERTLAFWDQSVFPGEVHHVRPTLVTLQPGRDLCYVTRGPADLGLSRAQIDRRVALLAERGLPPTLENFSCHEEALARS